MAHNTFADSAVNSEGSAIVLSALAVYVYKLTTALDRDNDLLFLPQKRQATNPSPIFINRASKRSANCLEDLDHIPFKILSPLEYPIINLKIEG